MAADPQLEAVLLYRGVLYAIRERVDRFKAHGEDFHGAFGEMLIVAPYERVREMLEDYDPMFGVYHAAEEMIIEGMFAMIIALDSVLYSTAYFRMSKNEATKELSEYPKSDRKLYRTMAAVFLDYLAVKATRA